MYRKRLHSQVYLLRILSFQIQAGLLSLKRTKTNWTSKETMEKVGIISCLMGHNLPPERMKFAQLFPRCSFFHQNGRALGFTACPFFMLLLKAVQVLQTIDNHRKMSRKKKCMGLMKTLQQSIRICVSVPQRIWTGWETYKSRGRERGKEKNPTHHRSLHHCKLHGHLLGTVGKSHALASRKVRGQRKWGHRGLPTRRRLWKDGQGAAGEDTPLETVSVCLW